jgi:hypothetical protein
MTQDRTEQFADTLIQRCQDLAMARSETVAIPFDKYIHIRDFTQILVFNCYSTAVSALENGEIKDSQLHDLFFEYLYFFIHLTDRFAFSTIGAPGRHTLMQELGEFAVMLAVQVLFPRSTDQQRDMIFQDRMGDLNIAAREYSHFPKLFPDGNEGTKDTLIWEFSKKIEKMMGSENNLGAVLGRHYVVITLLKNLDIKSFLNKMK